MISLVSTAPEVLEVGYCNLFTLKSPFTFRSLYGTRHLFMDPEEAARDIQAILDIADLDSTDESDLSGDEIDHSKKPLWETRMSWENQLNPTIQHMMDSIWDGCTLY